MSRDKERFRTEFTYAQEYVIPAFDVGTLLMSLLHLYILYSTEDEYTDFFEVTRIISEQLRRGGQNNNLLGGPGYRGYGRNSFEYVPGQIS